MHIKQYDLKLKLDPAANIFEGEVHIHLQKPQEVLRLHIHALTIHSVQYAGNIVRYTQNEDLQELTVLTVPQREEATIAIRYTGIITDTMSGLYHANSMLSTHFEAAGARQVFPCVDDPFYKAVFTVTIETPSMYEAISNMPVKTKTAGKNGYTVVSFYDTPVMSTYLLYIGVGKFVYCEKTYAQKKLRAIAVADKNPDEMAQPLEFASEFLSFLEDYFHIPYPLQTLDLIAVPQFSFGAMENWGAITFREMYLFIHTGTSTEVKRRIAEVIAHELVHQWFGNLVTMKWWNDLWLNESFATYMAFKAVGALYPSWNFWEEFLLTETAPALSADSLQQTHPIETEVKTPFEIDEAFDHISYGKGGSILRMIEAYIGETAFQTGLQAYLAQYAYKNTEGSMLWNALASTSEKDVSFIMSAWIKTPGFPVITVSMENNKVRLTQKRFSYNTQKSNVLWHVPIKMETGEGEMACLFNQKELVIPIENWKYILVNSHQTGFYLTSYSKELLETLLSHISELSDTAIYGIVRDAQFFFLADMISLAEFMEIIQHVSKHTSMLVMRTLIGIFSYFFPLLHETVLFHAVFEEFFMYHIERVGIFERTSEDESIAMVRSLLLEQYVILHTPFAGKLAHAYKDYNKAPANLRFAVARAHILTGTIDRAKEYCELLPAISSDEDKIRILRALGSSRDLEVFALLLSLIDSKKIKKQDIPLILISLARNTAQQDAYGRWFQGHFKSFVREFAGTPWPGRLIEEVVPYIGVRTSISLHTILSPEDMLLYHKSIEKGEELLAIHTKIFMRYQE